MKGIQIFKLIQIQILVSLLWRQLKQVPTTFHVQITSSKYCTLNPVHLVTCAQLEVGRFFSTQINKLNEAFYGAFESFKYNSQTIAQTKKCITRKL